MLLNAGSDQLNTTVTLNTETVERFILPLLKVQLGPLGIV